MAVRMQAALDAQMHAALEAQAAELTARMDSVLDARSAAMHARIQHLEQQLELCAGPAAQAHGSEPQVILLNAHEHVHASALMLGGTRLQPHGRGWRCELALRSADMNRSHR